MEWTKRYWNRLEKNWNRLKDAGIGWKTLEDAGRGLNVLERASRREVEKVKASVCLITTT